MKNIEVYFRQTEELYKCRDDFFLLADAFEEYNYPERVEIIEIVVELSMLFQILSCMVTFYKGDGKMNFGVYSLEDIYTLIDTHELNEVVDIIYNSARRK